MPLRAEPLLSERSVRGRRGVRYPRPARLPADHELPAHLRRRALRLPELSELDVVRHYTRLSQKNFGVDTHFIPLGSCTMKYNPKLNDRLSFLPGFQNLHPLTTQEALQGILELFFELEKWLCELCGMDAFTLQPAAGAHGELAGILIARAYHRSRKESARVEVLIPDSAHGTNPASAALGGFTVIPIRSNTRGRVDLEDFKSKLGPRTALVMLTVPNTLGLFEDEILEIARLGHEAGALLYLDGANLNALMGILKPGELGFDLLHLNLHKTFSIPHGGGGPGGGPLGVRKSLEDFLPMPRVVREKGAYRLRENSKKTIGRIRSFFGNVGALVRAYAYIRSLGGTGLRQVSETAVLHANYLRVRLRKEFPSFVDEPCMHECVLQAVGPSWNGVKTQDVAKRLLDFGFYAPTIYFPLIVPEALMIEPTETESKQTLDEFIEAMRQIAQEAQSCPERLRAAPHHTHVRRVDEVQAARKPNLRWGRGEGGGGL
ncbi:MAG: aminomethyl-transferring glycine dehydrogenase subunit GcvPB [Elusimicrobia bacterium]|nr:aminomethyl-transferring glycine dehydrogenase subunit GcvPB [Elusimicrobiota bacterium]